LKGESNETNSSLLERRKDDMQAHVSNFVS